MDDYGDFDQEYTDPYDCMPFGDALRFEDEQVFQDREQEDYFDEAADEAAEPYEEPL